MRKELFYTLLVCLGFTHFINAQTVTYLSPLEQPSMLSSSSIGVLPDGITSNPDYDYYNPYVPSSNGKYRVQYLITATEMQNAGFVNGDNIVSLQWVYASGQDIETTGEISLYMANTTDTTLAENPPMGNWVLSSTITIPDTAEEVHLDFDSPFVYSGNSIYITYEYTPNSYSTFDSLPQTYMNSALTNSIKGIYYLGGEYEGYVVYLVFSTRPLTLLGKANCSFSGVQFMDYTDISATVKIFGEPGEYEIEYGEFPYETGNGGETLLLTTTTVDEEVVISELTPGTAYNIFVKKICGDDVSSISTIIIGTGNSEPITELPYEENFDIGNQGYFVITRGWNNVPSSTNHSYWQLMNQNENSLKLGLRDWAGGPNFKTIYSRPIQLEANSTYTISFDYDLIWLGSSITDSENHPDLHILINSEVNEDGLIISSLTEIPYSETPLQHSFEFTPETSGVYYFGINGVFEENPTEDPNFANGAGFNWLHVDNFKVDYSLSRDNFEQTNIHIYPNPFNDVVYITAFNNIEKVEIYDLKGSLIHENKVNTNEVSINLSMLNSGVHFMRVTSQNNVTTHKIIKQ